MKRILTLTKIMLKSSGEGILPEKNRKLLMVVFGFAGIYIAGIVGFISHYIISNFAAFSQSGMSIYLLLTGITIYLLFVCFIMLPSIYYFSQDIQRYLVLPIKASEFMVARFLATLVKLYASMAIVYIPFGLAYLNVNGFSISFILLYLITGIFLPLIPMIIALSVIVISFTFIPFFRNKNLFTYITSGLAIIFAIAINMVSMNSVDPQAMIESLLIGIQTGTNTLVNLMNNVFPHLRFFIDAIVFGNLLSLMIGIVISCAAILVVMALIQGLYIKSALSIQEEAASSKQLSNAQINKRSRKTSMLWSLIKVDMKTILRTPVFAMNYFVMLFLLPIILLIPLFREGSLDVIMEALPEIQGFIAAIPFTELILYAITLAFLVSFFFGAFGMVASTAISREGKAMSQYKIMPMSLMTLINAKLVLSVLCLMIPVAIALITIGIILQVNPFIIILALIFGMIGSFASNVFNIFLDVYKPKLNWIQEQEAVKQNFLAIVPMFAIMGMAGVVGYVFIIVQSLIPVLIGSTIGFTLVSGLVYYVIYRMTLKHLPNQIS